MKQILILLMLLPLLSGGEKIKASLHELKPFTFTPPKVTAFTAVQTATQVSTTGTSLNITMTSTGAGNLIVVHIRISGTSITVSSVTDNVGNTYVVSAAKDNFNVRIYQAYTLGVIGGVTTITVNFSASVTPLCGADEYGGGPFLFDVSTTGSTTDGSSISVATLTPAATGELIVVTLGSNTGAPSWVAGSGYTNYTAANSTLQNGYRLSSGSSETAPWTYTGGTNRKVEIATAFKAAPNINNSKFFFEP